MHPAQAPSDPDSVRVVFQAMASPCEIVLSKDSNVDIQAAARHAIAEVQRIEAKYSRYRSDSIVARALALTPQPPHPHPRARPRWSAS